MGSPPTSTSGFACGAGTFPPSAPGGQDWALSSRRMGATECELIRDGFLAQPVNALSSLVLIVAGIVIVRRHRGNRMASVLGAIVALVGLGSFLFHGPQVEGSQLLHDWANVSAATAVASWAWAPRSGWSPTTPLRITVVAAVLSLAVLGSWIEAGPWLLAVAAVAAGWGLATRGRVALAAAAAFVAGAVLLVLGRTGGPLCDPASAWQPHAGWHLLAAIGFVLVAATLGRISHEATIG